MTVGRKHRAPFVALDDLLALRFPALADRAAAVRDGRVLVDGSVVLNPDARARQDASVRVLTRRPLRGAGKLGRGLDALAIDVAGAIAVDVGAAAGGFTSELLLRGATRVYAVDAGFGQLRGELRRDGRVVNLERTNLAELDTRRVPDMVDIITVDLSYLAIANAITQLDRLALSHDARLLALVKPTFESRASSLVTDGGEVRHAVALAIDAIDAIEVAHWRVTACTLPAVTGRNGAIEAFVLAKRPDAAEPKD